MNWDNAVTRLRFTVQRVPSKKPFAGGLCVASGQRVGYSVGLLGVMLSVHWGPKLTILKVPK